MPGQRRSFGRSALGVRHRAWMRPTVPVHGSKLVEFAIITAAGQRRMGQLKDADLTARRLMAFARRLVQDYPSQPESHMVLSEAYFQVSKNAWKREDYPAIEQELRQALDSARHAVRLNPQREDARHFVDRLLPRLVQFDTGRETVMMKVATRIPP